MHLIIGDEALAKTARPFFLQIRRGAKADGAAADVSVMNRSLWFQVTIRHLIAVKLKEGYFYFQVPGGKNPRRLSNASSITKSSDSLRAIKLPLSLVHLSIIVRLGCHHCLFPPTFKGDGVCLHCGSSPKGKTTIPES